MGSSSESVLSQNKNNSELNGDAWKVSDPWKIIKYFIIAAGIVTAILGVALTLFGGSGYYGGLGNAPIVIIAVIATPALLAIGSIINNAIKASRKEANSKTPFLSAGLMIAAVIDVLVFPFAFFFGHEWYAIGYCGAIITTIFGVMVLAYAVKLLCARDYAEKKHLIPAQLFASIAIFLNFAYLLHRESSYELPNGAIGVIAVYIIFLVMNAVYGVSKDSDRAINRGKMIAILSIIITIASLVIYYIIAWRDYLHYMF